MKEYTNWLTKNRFINWPFLFFQSFNIFLISTNTSVFQKPSAIILSNFSSSPSMCTVKCLEKYCISIFPDSCASAIPEYMLCCPESPNTVTAVTLRGEQINKHHTSTYQIEYPQVKSPLICVCRHLSESILSVTTGSASFFTRSHMWRVEAASSTQKTAGLVHVQCSETTASPAVPFFHSATGCSRLTWCSLMLPSPHPTCNKDGGSYLMQWYFE